jgi:hypothetical protein
LLIEHHDGLHLNDSRGTLFCREEDDNDDDSDGTDSIMLDMKPQHADPEQIKVV